MNSREVIEGRQNQGTDEQIAYVFALASGTNPESPDFTLWDLTGGSRTDVSATKLAGDAVVDGDNVTSPLVHGLVEGHAYRLQLTYATNGNTLSAFANIEAEF